LLTGEARKGVASKADWHLQKVIHIYLSEKGDMAALVSIAQPSLGLLDPENHTSPDRAPEAVLQDADRITVHTGNIASWSKLRRRAVLTTTDELILGTEAALKSWLGRGSTVESRAELSISNAALSQKVGRDERDNFIFSLKVFLSLWDGNVVRTAVSTTMEELGVQHVDSIVVAFPPSPTDEDTMTAMKDVWKSVEQLVRDGVTKSVGVADLMRPQLEELYHWASVKPNTDQLNLAHCCTIPEDLAVFSKEHGMTLNTHNDEKEVLPDPQLHALVGGVCGSHDNRWRYNWAARYSSVVRMRGIVAHKG
jgi:glutamate--cysteine ligase regulatory subunit